MREILRKWMPVLKTVRLNLSDVDCGEEIGSGELCAELNSLQPQLHSDNSVNAVSSCSAAPGNQKKFA